MDRLSPLMVPSPLPAMTPPEPSSSRAPTAAVRFPDAPSASSSRQTSLSQASTLGLGLPPSRRAPSTADTPPPSPGYFDDERRRRVRSAGAPARTASAGSQHAINANGIGNGSAAKPRRASLVDSSWASSEYRPRRVTMSASAPLAELGEGVFSDEYDLSHEDPKILEEVQHALRLKARRDARQQQRTSLRTASSASSLPPAPSLSPSPAPASPTYFPRARPAAPAESEPDFAPRVGVARAHPVPLSFNDGRTLDWGPAPEGEDAQGQGRWGMGLARRRREKAQEVSRDVLDRQAARWAERTTRTRASMSAQTLRKAEITRSQLARRYAVLDAHPDYAPTRVAAWHAALAPAAQAALEAAEPPTWLRHLRDRTLQRTGRRAAWHVTALIAEEHARAQRRPHDAAGPGPSTYMSPIPEDGVASAPGSREASPGAPGGSVGMGLGIGGMGMGIGASVSRRRSFDGTLSFEPRSAGRRSLGDDAHGHQHTVGFRRNADREQTESPRSSIYSASSRNEMSPASSRARVRGFGRRGGAGESDDLASPLQSASEDSDAGRRSGRRRAFRLRPGGLELVGRASTLPDVRPDAGAPSREGSDGLPTPGANNLLTPRVEDVTPLAFEALAPPPQRPPAPSRANSRVFQLRGYRTSLPSVRARSPSATPEERIRADADEEDEAAEYERRAQLLESTAAQNARNRALLHRVAGSVREHEAVLARMARTLGLPHAPLPDGLLDALAHDPAVVTGHTRAARGWAAVERVHEHVRAQQDALAEFLAAGAKGRVEVKQSVLAGSLAAFYEALDRLDGEQEGIREKGEEVAGALARVKTLQAEVKREYNAASQHTSVVYPELSQILSLEDGYNNRFQSFQDFAQDALTFVLDAAVPFWRNYGKVIGVDVQDFLIVPWYRNEFTGEPARYKLAGLPKRSARHWFCLMLLADLAGTVLIFQARGAWISVRAAGVPLRAPAWAWAVTVPAFWVGVGMQCVAVLVEAAIVLGMLAVMAWWVAWFAGVVD